MEKLTYDQMENLVGGSFGTCFDEALLADIAFQNYRDKPNDRTFTLWVIATGRLFECAIA